MLERRETYRNPTTRIRRSLCRQMVPEYRTPLPRPKSLSGLGHSYAHVTVDTDGRTDRQEGSLEKQENPLLI